VLRAVLDQEIRFLAVDGARVAVGIAGAGPPLVLPAWWVSNLEANWRSERFRAFIGGLARRHTVVRYDRVGTGLSDRARPGDTITLEWEMRTLAAVADALDLERFDMLGVSFGGAVAGMYADRHPERVGRVVTFGAYARGADLAPPEVRASVLSMVRAHWGLGSRLLAEVWLPGADARERAELTEYQRTAADPETAAALLTLAYEVDARTHLARMRAPALVLHRRDDRAAPFDRARELAALVPGARLLPLDGSAHPPWHGHVASVVESALAFLASPERPGEPRPAPPAAAPADLSQREVEILRLVAGGLNDTQIAQALFLSPHTVHRHVANIRAKLRQPTRAAAAVEATRLRLI
jgi:pimeloyl-ACP methyl ester carboxylesterase/DNA-binding CsgD family transcriptional regulator